MLYSATGRVEEARILYEGAIELADLHGLGLALLRAQLNSGDLLMRFDAPGAVERSQEALASTRRFGDRMRESVAASNLMVLGRLTGRWGEAERLAAEMIGDNPASRPFGEAISVELCVFAAVRGDVEGARRHLDAIAGWKENEDAELHGTYAALAGGVALAEGRAEVALDMLAGTLRTVLATGMHSGDTARQAWPDAIDAAVAAGRMDTLAELVELLAEKPRGWVAPYMRAHLARARAFVAVAEADHEAAEAHLRTALDSFTALAYPYWVARVQVQLAAWLVEQGRASEAAPLLDEAVATLEELGAAPALARARELAVNLRATSPPART
jgi:tetratricopeptide (TPR) repeat protein